MIQHVHENYIEIAGSWERDQGLKSTKTGKKRVVPIPVRVYENIQAVIACLSYREPEDFVFCGDRRAVPITQHTVWTHFIEALEKIGIKKTFDDKGVLIRDMREERRLVFHSWRHTFNSLLLSRNVSPDRVRSLTGHSSEKMTEHYTHFTPDDFKDVLKIQEDLF
jgi:integrase